MTVNPNIYKLTLIKLWIFTTLIILVIILLELMTNLLGLNALTIYMLLLFFLIGFTISLPLSQGIHKISIDGNIFIATNLITRKSFSLNIEDFKEFYLNIHFSRYGGFHLDLVFSDSNNSYEPISLYYLESVHELVNELENKLRNTTKDEYGILDFLKTNNKN
jgi:hypothetical protein